ncbi:MAG: DUF2065 domain-containing protein [Deltaproteobacteria bacterium]|nr:DUF2065 domain-containing protein [Deltaproteobacteria bacterium]
MKFFFCLIGMVMIVEGLPYFVCPAQMKVWVRKILDMPNNSLQKSGLILMLIGLFCVYLGKT